jgi:mRNA-degrading endonuclease RelE of RelBE toxin-antitoxin system
MSRIAYTLKYDAEVVENLRWIPHWQHSVIRLAIEEQLKYQPDTATQNRKPLKSLSTDKSRWELRCGARNQFRVIYGVEPEAHTVTIAVIGVKKGNQLWVNGEEYEL